MIKNMNMPMFMRTGISGRFRRRLSFFSIGLRSQPADKSRQGRLFPVPARLYLIITDQ
jgi:hypothetical protein